MHAGAIRIKYAGDFDVDVVLVMVVVKQGFGASFAFVVTGSGADWVDIAPVTFGLGVDGGVAVDFAGRGQ